MFKKLSSLKFYGIGNSQVQIEATNLIVIPLRITMNNI